MTFRPSDDVLEEMADGQKSQGGTSQYGTYNNSYNTNYNVDGSQGIGQQGFQQSQNYANGAQGNYAATGNGEIESDPEAVLKALNIPIEEVKAPDLTDLLNGGGQTTVTDSVATNPVATNTQPVQNTQTAPSVQPAQNNQSVQNNQVASNTIQQNPQTNTVVVNNTVANTAVAIAETQQNIEIDDIDLLTEEKISDVERTSLVKSIEGGISSNFDFLVDKQRLDSIMGYKKIHRILVRWGCVFICSLVGLCLGVYAQMGENQPSNFRIVKDKTIENFNQRKINTPDKEMQQLVDSGVNVDVMVPYGIVSISKEAKTFQTNSNLIKYNGFILPQLISINYGSENLISLEDFTEGKTTRKDLEALVQKFALNRYGTIPNSYENRRVPNRFDGDGGLIDGFSLGCIDNYKVSDVMCDRFLESFYKYGKYYELSDPQYSSEILSIMKKLKSQGKDIEPVCNMVNEYVLHVGKISNDFDFIMQYCEADEYNFYKKLVSFIELEASLGQPELSDRVFDDPDLNAYKLLSARQTTYKIIGGTFNENYIKSYLSYVQALLNKDNKTNRYLAPIYKDMLYIFNMDQLYQKVLQNGKSELKIQMDQINNGNTLYKYPGLLSQLTTPDIINSTVELSGTEAGEVTIEDIFAQYYSMKDRLRIRSVNRIGDNELLVKTELFTNKIFSVTDNETLKLTVSLYRNGNVLYVSNVKVTNQPKLSEILNIQASNGNTSFNSLLGIVDEQIGMWYEVPSDGDEETQPTLCDILQEREDLTIYTCDDSAISLYKGDVEYNFDLVGGVLNTFIISDELLESMIKEKIEKVMIIKDNTPTIITSIIDFTVETTDDSIEKKVEIINQFRIHFKLIPDDIQIIEGAPDDFLVEFTLGAFNLQAKYNMETHMLTNVSYVACEKTLEIKPLQIAITTENESQLTEISNNPQVFFTQVNPAAYKKYQKMCEGDKE